MKMNNTQTQQGQNDRSEQARQQMLDRWVENGAVALPEGATDEEAAELAPLALVLAREEILMDLAAMGAFGEDTQAN
jgi:hypothetical protein